MWQDVGGKVMAEKEYVEREAAEKELLYAMAGTGYQSRAIDAIKFMLTADVVEVVHGEWIEHEWAEEENGLLISNFECSACHNWERKRSDYCPNCGAEMDEKDGEGK
jgi:hypothetical protein